MLQIHLFGGLRVMLDGKPVTGFYSNKASALVAYLALTRRAPTRDALAALFWGEMSDADSKMNLRQCLTNLRKLLEPHLLIARDSVEFNFDAPYALDIEQFEQKIRVQDLNAAVDLYRGDFLDGVFVRDAPDFEEWMLAQRARLRELALQAMSTLVTQSAASGEHARGIEYATRLLALDPWREETHRELMLMLARTGQRSGALQQYEICKRVLAEQMGVEPSAETNALHERIRAAGATTKNNLAPQVTSFVGRARALAQIGAALLKPECRLITLLGTGGVGKTRLALASAERALQIGAFLNGIYFVSLAGVDSPDLLAPAIANACEFSFSGKQDPKTQVANFLRDKEILLVLDNLEHLLDASLWLSQLLKSAPHLKLLVTSRERLNVQAEWLIAVEGLDESSAAMQLFVERARQAKNNFELNDANRVSVARVCRLVEGLPLGIELAAAWVQTHSTEEIAREIERGYDFLATTQRDAPARQKSLRAVFDHSWQWLAANERAVFSKLSVFRGGFSRQAAERIVGASLATLTALVDKSLVRHHAERYDLHPVVLEYAGEKLASEHEPTQDSHSAYYAEWMAQCHARLFGNAEHATIAAMTLEIENVRAAWWHAVNTSRFDEVAKIFPGLHRLYDVQSRYREGEDLFGKTVALLGDKHPALRMQLLARQASFLADLGQVQRAVELLTECLADSREQQQRDEILFCLKLLGNTLRVMGKFEESKIYLAEFLDLSRRANLPGEIATALNNLGVIANSQGAYAESAQLLGEALTLRRTIDNRPGIASCLLNLATTTTNVGQYAESERSLCEALDICREFGDRRKMAAISTNLGSIAHHTGRYAEAKEFYQQALELHRETGFRFGIAIALDNIGSVSLDLREFADARTSLYQSLVEAQANKLDLVSLDVLVGIAILQMHDGKCEQAIELLALAISHPSVDNETVIIARQRRDEFAKQLAPNVVAQAELRGRARKLDETVFEILREHRT